jgi:hypothetical protein
MDADEKAMISRALGDAISWQNYLLSEFEHPDFSPEATLAKRRLVQYRALSRSYPRSLAAAWERTEKSAGR